MAGRLALTMLEGALLAALTLSACAGNYSQESAGPSSGTAGSAGVAGAGGAGTAGAGTAGGAGAIGTAGVAGCPLSLCVGLDCVPGSHLEVLPGACCPSCVPDAMSCITGQMDYATVRQQLLSAFPSACSTVSDCTWVQDDVRCGFACSQTPVSWSAAMAINPKLASVAATDCASCSMAVPPCLPPAGQLACIGGVCTLESLQR
jgi:hypothetical protein